jgi:uncharacterized repeat protein (TIGR03803 family)
MPNDPSSFYRGVLAATIFSLILTASALARSEKILHNFLVYPQGATPTGRLAADSAGNLYGTTELGGEHGWGTVFKLTRDSDGGWARKTIHSFKVGHTDGGIPAGAVVSNAAGNLYGAAEAGGSSAYGCGVVYELVPGRDGKWTENILYNFTGTNGDGCNPNGTLAFDASGNLYGTTGFGGGYGDDGGGTVFEITPSSSGWTETTLYSYQSTSGPGSGVILDKSGNLYGAAEGFIFQLVHKDGSWTQNVLCNCQASYGSLVFGKDGNLYGSGVNTPGYVFELERRHDWRLVALYTFGGGSDGESPGQFIFDAAGDLYGVTDSGGIGGTCFDGYGCGTIFKLTHKRGNHWIHKVLFTFNSNNVGESPLGLVMDAGGNLYGTTQLGGDQYCNPNPDQAGCGTLFALTPTSGHPWKYRRILSFPVGDGQQPESSLVSDNNGNLYGTAPSGGAYNGGIVFELARKANGTWKETILHSFGGQSDGLAPIGNLIFDSSGDLYGVTASGLDCGTVFELKPDSDGTWMESVLHVFACYPTDGMFPRAGLVFDSSGNLYGSTAYGGNTGCQQINWRDVQGCGVVFELSPSPQGGWTETILHSFTGYPNDGFFPDVTLAIDPTGNLYGSTAYGGSSGCQDRQGNTVGCGTLFQLSQGSGEKWSETAYYSFPSGSFSSALAFDQRGDLYGTTATGGTYGGGTFYQVISGATGWTVNPLYNFGSHQGDGLSPNGVTFNSLGNAYGTTNAGGLVNCNGGHTGCGTVFELSPGSGGAWSEGVLYDFTGLLFDGSSPLAGVILDASGNLFGTTTQGGSEIVRGTAAGGTVFEVTP